MIHIVFDKGDAILSAQSNQRRLQQIVASQFVSHQIVQVQTFRRSVFDVPHVEIEPSAVEEKTAVARRLFVVPVMQVDDAGARLAKKVVFHLGRPQL